VVFLGERCDGEINVTEIQDHLDLTGELSISVMPRSREYIYSSPCDFVRYYLLSITENLHRGTVQNTKNFKCETLI
jgi:hypothetical protein